MYIVLGALLFKSLKICPVFFVSVSFLPAIFILMPSLCYPVTVSLLFLSTALAQTCFSSNRTPLPDQWQPCVPSDHATNCCQTNSSCLANGLCVLQADSSFNTGGCTDKEWATASCFQFCLKSKSSQSFSIQGPLAYCKIKHLVLLIMWIRSIAAMTTSGVAL